MSMCPLLYSSFDVTRRVKIGFCLFTSLHFVEDQISYTLRTSNMVQGIIKTVLFGEKGRFVSEVPIDCQIC